MEQSLLREAILSAPLDTRLDEKPTLETFYLPPSYNRALRADAPLIIGNIGAGKSYLAAALQDGRLRVHMSEEGGVDTRWLQSLDDVTVGFGGEKADSHPSAGEMDRLVGEHGAYNVWQAVILRWLARRDGLSIPTESWEHTIGWLRANPLEAARLAEKGRSWSGLIVFDGLDRITKDWRRMEDVVDGLLKAVSFSVRSRLHAKVFLREDIAEQTLPNLGAKHAGVMANLERLCWRSHDLQAMLWHRLVNAPGKHGECFRRICPSFERNGVWYLARQMKLNGRAQQEALRSLVGPARIGRFSSPYAWMAGFLADSRGQTFPQSFLAAIRQAVADTQERYPDYAYALHPESLRRGIQQAAEVRLQEIDRRAPWAVELLSALKGMSVPAEISSVDRLWRDRFFSVHQPFDAIFRRFDSLPPPTTRYGWSGVLMDLARLGLLDVKQNLNMPEIYRVGFGLGRRGGVKPKAQASQQAENGADESQPQRQRQARLR